MKVAFLIWFHTLRMNWHRTNANSLVTYGYLNHETRMQMSPEYRDSYIKYQESKRRLQELGALPVVGRR